MIIDLPRFIATERPTWEELERLLNRLAGSPLERPTLPQAQRFHFLFQKVSADLARLNTFASEPQLRRYLEALVARAYGEIHETRGVRRRWPVLHWFFGTFPATFRRRWVAFLISVLVFLAGGILGGFALSFDSEAKEALIPAQFSHLMGDPAERVRHEEEESVASRHGGAKATFASTLMVNNIRVSINAMAFGMTCGAGTLLLLFYTGLTLGVIAADYIGASQTMFLLGWLLPHGVIEIPSVLIAGQAGLVLGGAILGRGQRAGLAERLRAVAPDVMNLIGGVAVLLVWAGLVESYFSQHHQPVMPYSLKIAFGCVEFALLARLLSAKPKPVPPP